MDEEIRGVFGAPLKSPYLSSACVVIWNGCCSFKVFFLFHAENKNETVAHIIRDEVLDHLQIHNGCNEMKILPSFS